MGSRRPFVAAIAISLALCGARAEAIELGGCKLDVLNPKGTFDCLRKAFDKLKSNAEKSLKKAGAAVADAAGKILPKGLMDAFGKLKDTLECVAKKGGQRGFDPGKLVGDVLQNAPKVIQSIFDRVWPEVQKVMGSIATGVAPKDPTLPKLLAALAKPIDTLVSKLGPLSCATKLVKPALKQVEPLVLKLAAQVEKSIFEAGRKIVAPLVAKLATSALEWIVSKLGGEKGVQRMREIASRVLLAVDRIATAGKRIGDITLALKQRTGLDKAMGAAKELGAGGEKFTLSAMVDVVKELAKDRAKDFVHEKGGELIDTVLKSISSVYNVLNRVIGSLCGLIPEVGGVICELALSAGLRTSWTWLLSVQLKGFVLEQIESWVAKGIDYVAGIAREKFANKADEKTAAARKQLGQLARALDPAVSKLLAYLREHVQPAFTQMREYNEQVRALAEAAVEAAKRTSAPAK
jgi:hypothetical protein